LTETHESGEIGRRSRAFRRFGRRYTCVSAVRPAFSCEQSGPLGRHALSTAFLDAPFRWPSIS